MATEQKVYLTDEQEIKEAKALVKSVEFSIFYRKGSLDSYKENTKSFQKLLKYLESENNKKHHEAWQPITQQVKKGLENNDNVIETSIKSNECEEEFLEELRNHIYKLDFGEPAFDKEYFQAVIKQARIYGNTEITPQQVELMKIKDFIKDEKELYEWK